MTRGVEAETVHKRRQMRSEHRYLFRGSCECRARPQTCCDRQARYPIARVNWNNNQVELHIPVDG